MWRHGLASQASNFDDSFETRTSYKYIDGCNYKVVGYDSIIKFNCILLLHEALND